MSRRVRTADVMRLLREKVGIVENPQAVSGSLKSSGRYEQGRAVCAGKTPSKTDGDKMPLVGIEGGVEDYSLYENVKVTFINMGKGIAEALHYDPLQDGTYLRQISESISQYMSQSTNNPTENTAGGTENSQPDQTSNFADLPMDQLVTYMVAGLAFGGLLYAKRERIKSFIDWFVPRKKVDKVANEVEKAILKKELKSIKDGLNTLFSFMGMFNTNYSDELRRMGREITKSQAPINDDLEKIKTRIDQLGLLKQKVDRYDGRLKLMSEQLDTFDGRLKKHNIGKMKNILYENNTKIKGLKTALTGLTKKLKKINIINSPVPIHNPDPSQLNSLNARLNTLEAKINNPDSSQLNVLDKKLTSLIETLKSVKFPGGYEDGLAVEPRRILVDKEDGQVGWAARAVLDAIKPYTH